MKGIHNMKKILGIILGSTVVASTLLSFGVSAASASDFSDMPDDWSTAALTAAVDNGLLTGSDGMILPKDNLTRAQMATIISRAFGAVSTVELSDFTDVPADKWYYEYMQKAVAMGTFKGDDNGLLTPDANITREAVFAVLARAFKLEADENETFEKFADKDAINSSWAKKEISALVAGGYVSGSLDNETGELYLNLKKEISRQEFAKIMHNMVKTYIDEDNAVLFGEYEGGVIIRASSVVVDETAKISGNLVISEAAENVTISEKAAISKIVDNRKVEDEKKDEEEPKETDTKTETDDGTLLSPTTPPAGEGTGSEDKPAIEFESNEGWSQIYRPGKKNNK